MTEEQKVAAKTAIVTAFLEAVVKLKSDDVNVALGGTTVCKTTASLFVGAAATAEAAAAASRETQTQQQRLKRLRLQRQISRLRRLQREARTHKQRLKRLRKLQQLDFAEGLQVNVTLSDKSGSIGDIEKLRGDVAGNRELLSKISVHLGEIPGFYKTPGVAHEAVITESKVKKPKEVKSGGSQEVKSAGTDMTLFIIVGALGVVIGLCVGGGVFIYLRFGSRTSTSGDEVENAQATESGQARRQAEDPGPLVPAPAG